MSDDFATGQIFLQNATRQLLWWDDFNERVRALVRELKEDVERDLRSKDLFYGPEPCHRLPDPLNPDVNSEVNSMNIDRLLKQVFEDSLSPARVAALYIQWLHAFLGTMEPNPLPEWLQKLRAHVEAQCAPYTSNRLADASEREVYALLTLYVSVLLDWITDLRATLTFGGVATALGRTGRRLGQGPRERLSDYMERLLSWAAVVDIIEQDILVDKVLPDDWRRLLDPHQLDGFPARVLAEHSTRNTRSAAARREQARARAETLLASARAAADLTRSHDLLLTFARARLTLASIHTDWQLLMDRAQESAQGNGARAKRRRPPSRTSPPRSTKGRAKPASGTTRSRSTSPDRRRQ